MDEITELKAEIAKLKALTAEKEDILFRAEQKLISIESEVISTMLQSINHSLICPFCGVTVGHPPSIGITHVGCYRTGYWAKGFKTQNDWVRACIDNGKNIYEVYQKESKPSIG